MKLIENQKKSNVLFQEKDLEMKVFYRSIFILSYATNINFSCYRNNDNDDY